MRNLSINDELITYISKKDNKQKKDILVSNSLFDKFGNIFFEFEKEDYDEINNNKKLSLVYKYELVKICNLFLQNQIDFFTFKGVVLSFLLYDSVIGRVSNDIDIYVNKNCFEQALYLLKKNGYVLKSKEELKKEHHVVMIKDNLIVLELHKNIYHPMVKIDETYLKANVKSLELYKNRIITFNITSTFLHLIYHLYMDTYLASGNMYSLLTNKKSPRAGRFLYRAYEISLYSEKYYNEINWKDIENDISTQKLRIIFMKMIFDILRIFPSVFPKSFVDTVRKIDYVEDERDKLYKYLIDIDINNCNDFDALISKFIDDNWDARRKKNICEKVGETISLAKKSLGEKQELNCVIDTEKTKKGLKIVFKVSNDDFYISEMGNYDTQTSDGVHLLLCGTEQYSYNSIFFFPKQNDGEIRVVVCDVLNNRNIVLSDNLIKAEFSKTERDYTITAILSNEFLKENNLNSYLYMGLVISDCSSETHRRKNQLILSEDDSQLQ